MYQQHRRKKNYYKIKVEIESASTTLKAAQINPITNKPLSSHISYKSVPESYGEREGSTRLKTESNDERQAALNLGHQQYFSTWHKKN